MNMKNNLKTKLLFYFVHQTYAAEEFLKFFAEYLEFYFSN